MSQCTEKKLLVHGQTFSWIKSQGKEGKDKKTRGRGMVGEEREYYILVLVQRVKEMFHRLSVKRSELRMSHWGSWSKTDNVDN